MRMLVPFSMTCSPLSVHCGGVAFASNVMSLGIIYKLSVQDWLYGPCAVYYITSDKCLQRATVHEEAGTKHGGYDAVHLYSN